MTQTFGPAALVQRCQVHKRRNVLEYLPEVQRPWVKATLTRAYTHTDVKAARRLLQDLARRVDVDYPSAAASIREGLDETLTVVELQLSERLRRSLATNQRRREPPEPDTPREAERETLARGYDGAPLGRCRCAGSGQRIPAGEGV